MKLNAKIYRDLTGEPFETQNINGKIVELHYMNDTPYFYAYANKGNFSIWTSDGNNYKVLIEKDYYESLKSFYDPKVNELWMTFLEEVGTVQKKVRLFYLLPMILVYIAVIIIVQTFFQEQLMIGLIVLIVVMFGSNMIQSRYVTKKIKEKNIVAQEGIQNYLGAEELERIVNARDEHYRRFFDVKDEDAEVVEQSNELLEENKEIEEVEVVDENDSK